MKRLYKCTSEMIQPCYTEYGIKEMKPGIIKAYSGQILSAKSILQNIYWWLVTKGAYRVWCAYDGDFVVHTSYVIPKCNKFPFLNGDSYEIGPCHTNSDYRGKGIYPAVLTEIVNYWGGVQLI